MSGKQMIAQSKMSTQVFLLVLGSALLIPVTPSCQSKRNGLTVAVRTSACGCPRVLTNAR